MHRHTREHIFYHRRRKIAHRLRLMRRIWGWVPHHAGRLSKWNLVCSCWVCRGPKYRQQRAREKRRQQSELWGEERGGG